MFASAYDFKNHDLSGWNVSKVTDHTDFFRYAGSGNTEPIWPDQD
jgi:surface protein